MLFKIEKTVFINKFTGCSRFERPIMNDKAEDNTGKAEKIIHSKDFLLTFSLLKK